MADQFRSVQIMGLIETVRLGGVNCPQPSTLYPVLKIRAICESTPRPSGQGADDRVDMNVSKFVIMTSRQTQIVNLDSSTRLDRPRCHLRIFGTLYPLPYPLPSTLYPVERLKNCHNIENPYHL